LRIFKNSQSVNSRTVGCWEFHWFGFTEANECSVSSGRCNSAADCNRHCILQAFHPVTGGTTGICMVAAFIFSDRRYMYIT